MKIGIILKWYIFITSVYLLSDAIVHLLDFKLIDVILTWPVQAVFYSKFIGHLYGFFAILVAIFGIEVQRNIKKYKNLIYLTAVWLVFYGINLLITGLGADFSEIFTKEPSVYVWLPSYNLYLVFESVLCFVFAGLTLFWWKSEREAGKKQSAS